MNSLKHLGRFVLMVVQLLTLAVLAPIWMPLSLVYAISVYMYDLWEEAR
jgi:hypothetical protein